MGVLGRRQEYTLNGMSITHKTSCIHIFMPMDNAQTINLHACFEKSEANLLGQ